MSKELSQKPLDGDEHGRGPNLWLLYGFFVFALLAAMAVAGAIVYPFYLRR